MSTARRTPDQLLAAEKVRGDLEAARLRTKVLRAKSKALDNVAERAKWEKLRAARRGHGPQAHVVTGRGTTGPQARYDNATRTRLRPAPRATGGSAQKHLLTAKRYLRLDCQDAGRNSVVGRAIIKSMLDAVVGDGGIVTSSSSDAAFNEYTDRLWNRWCEGTDSELGHPDVRMRHGFWGLMRLGVKSWATDGDGLLHWLPNGQIRLVESELIINPGAVPGVVYTGENGSIIDGVEVDFAGKPVRYHLGQWGPWLGGVIPSNPHQSVPAGEAVLLVNPFDDTIGMVRGEPALQAIVDKIERLDNCIIKAGLQYEIQTLFGGVIKTNAPDVTKKAMEDQTPDQPTPVDEDTSKDTRLEAAGVLHLEPGEDWESIEPKSPGPNFREFLYGNLMIICADAGIPVAEAFLDASGMSWSNIKALLSMRARRVEYAQDYLVAAAVKPTRNRMVARWRDAGLYDGASVMLPDENGELVKTAVKIPPDWEACHVVMPAPPNVDEKSAAEAHAILVQQNLRTKDQATQLMGSGRFADVVRQRGVERRLEERNGVVPVALPGAKAENKQDESGASSAADEGSSGAGAGKEDAAAVGAGAEGE